MSERQRAVIPLRRHAGGAYSAVMTASTGPDSPAGTGWRVTSGTTEPATVDRLLRLLPQWFGIESANQDYVRAAGELPAYLAWPDPGSGTATGTATGAGPGELPQPAGVLLVRRHFPGAAEIHLMAVDPAQHRRGAGRALVQAAEAGLIADGVEFLQVKTLGPARPDAGYARTRQFYASMGFRPLEEIHGLWPENPCLILVKALGAA